ncbi:hypothetical protein [Mycolicibacterium confluentis]|uniref:Uncharacterized protein n=1 Tax=Mycolicibacterium confluentis TaxID=28047 RepID=A0A7I7Y2E5_9MYCO|nr:hypothetical protein [Mycolicibacterium confluentis]BBZ35787.1 hypothetical protein MCNF_43920 [Mycolicibacterium confluentis]
MSVLHPAEPIRIGRETDDDPHLFVPATDTRPNGFSLRDLRVAAANQLELWASGQECDDFRRDYLNDLVADLRASALDVEANQLDLWSAGKVCDEQRRSHVLGLVAELRALT